MPKVFLDYTQEQLVQAYDQLVWTPHRDAIQAEIRKKCEAVRKAIFAAVGASRAPVLVYALSRMAQLEKLVE